MRHKDLVEVHLIAFKRSGKYYSQYRVKGEITVLNAQSGADEILDIYDVANVVEKSIAQKLIPAEFVYTIEVHLIAFKRSGKYYSQYRVKGEITVLNA